VVTYVKEFGAIGFQPIRENLKIAYLKLNDDFLASYGLAYRPEMEEFEQSANLVLEKPVIKPQFPKMA
jgi:dynein heavy chain